MAVGTCYDYLRENDSPDRLRIVRRSPPFEDYAHFEVLQLSEVADALHYLHSRSPKIIHGDVRSVRVYCTCSFVFISGAGTAFLGNFDFLPLQRPIANRFDDTDTHEILEAVRWLAPEVGTGNPHNKRSDVFAFGMFGYELFSGHVPFPDVSGIDAGGLIRRNERPPRPDTPLLADEVWGLIRQCWRRAAPARPSMEELSRRLQELLAQASNTTKC
ncbi:kinase-like protein [Exidia glandulosa HHB12029]|uniref:Kinase-like protein n=1 Tax=Exidia glandulosa HHB12029 TaxID=1314781 RepID=A0A166MR57_EXIGL|nr:kinase-like protein [Exidia glandulosa HHB12029]